MEDELIAKLSGATCAADVQSIAAENGKELSEDEAEAIYAEVQKAKAEGGELTEEELDKASGGSDNTRAPIIGPDGRVYPPAPQW